MSEYLQDIQENEYGQHNSFSTEFVFDLFSTHMTADNGSDGLFFMPVADNIRHLIADFGVHFVDWRQFSKHRLHVLGIKDGAPRLVFSLDFLLENLK